MLNKLIKDYKIEFFILFIIIALFGFLVFLIIGYKIEKYYTINILNDDSKLVVTNIEYNKFPEASKILINYDNKQYFFDYEVKEIYDNKLIIDSTSLLSFLETKNIKFTPAIVFDQNQKIIDLFIGL
ncbi:hypothetical protein GE118_02940 [Mycoplasma sp. NEAQ87857]|uniref:MAG1140 family protein n=1 Tax=Mycoplasma sp. NEAQ87857 TaxID=2683967 RepID=UPI0013196C15|nr:hypothetical protein [Mycoplasma sp. NEAQ87857]QGZ97746.1 hypothetical protein GE118_02940 [Mycoplasma sp. NEAQ87857]